MGEIKNPFNFGTGNIDKDQWLKDIDNELEDFISKYGSATNKHRTALIRLAFLDLRSRIANGDMLGRTADGLYQFSSALNREDEYMQEAYQRALGFMGNLARRQINTPVTEPEKKKYSTAILNDRFIKYFNPSGSKESFTSLWNSFDDATRKSKLLEFLRKELNTGLSNYQDVEDYESMDNLKLRINDFLATSDITNLNRLGFTRNYLNALTSEEDEEEPKSELEQVKADIAAAQEAQQVAQGRLYLSYNANKGTTNFNLNVPTYDFNKALLNYLSNVFNDEQSRLAAAFNPSFNLNEAKAEQARKYIALQQQDLNNYFASFATSWRSNYESGQNNRDTMLNYLSRLFATYNKGINTNGTPITDYAYDWKKYFTLIGDNQFLINGSLNKNTGRYAYYVPGQGIMESNILDTSNPYIAQLLGYTIPSLKLGGKVEFLQSGGGFDYDAWAALLEEPKALVTNKPQQTKVSSNLKTSGIINGDKKASDMDVLDWTGILAPTILDITSMLSANVPGYGTLTSAGLGAASTLWTGVRDWLNEGWKSGLTTLGSGLVADAVGLVPGLGSSAKLGKIAKGLSKYAKYIGPALVAKGFGDAAGVFHKWMTLGSSSLTKDDLNTLLYGLTGLTSKGVASVKRANRSNLERAALRTYRVESKNGNTVFLNTEQLAKLRKQHKVVSAKPVVTQDALLEAQDEIMNASKWPIFGSVSEDRLKKMLSFKHVSLSNVLNNTMFTHNRGVVTATPAYSPIGLNGLDWGLNLHIPTKQRSLDKFKSFKEKYKKNKQEALKAGSNNAESERLGGVLKAMRNGGIIKAKWGWEVTSNTSSSSGPLLWGWNTSLEQSDSSEITPSSDATYMVVRPSDLPYSNLRQTINFKDASPTFFIDKDITKNKLDADRGTTLAASRSKYSVPAPGGQTLQNYKSAMDAQLAYYKANEGKSIMGDVYTYYNTWKQLHPNDDYDLFITDYNGHVKNIRDAHFTKFEVGTDGKPKHKVNENNWRGFNQEHHLLYPSYGEYDLEKEDYFGESTWRRLPNAFDGDDDMKELRSGFLKEGDNTSYIHMKNDGTLEIVKPPEYNTNGVKESGNKKEVVDLSIEEPTTITTHFENPIDPSLSIIGAKTAMGLAGNRNIYENLLEEMPQAPLRDPIDRKLAIVGWQERIKNGLNQLADLRRIQQMQQGADQQTNFATALDADRIGRDIMDKSLQEDSGRKFETAQKSWNLENEDVLYNIGVGDANRKSIADRARMMAQIRAAWRSGNNNILMGALSDTGNWLMKKYQREQDLTDKVKELSLGNLESYADWALRNHPTYKLLLAKKLAGTLTEADRAKMLEIRMSMLDKLADEYANKYYNLYHTSMFGGGSKELLLKDGGSLEKEKLKARGKDNDRYVSMIKDLRTTTYRRRRRR